MIFDCCYWGDPTYERGWDYIDKLSKDFNFTHIIKRENKSNYLHIIKQAKIMVLPYRFMAVRPPLTLIESMALGKCVVTSNIGGNSELINSYVNGVIKDFNNIDSVKHCLHILLENEPLRRNIETNARLYAKLLYNDYQYERIFDAYRKSVKGN